jgi:hypothetical protein
VLQYKGLSIALLSLCIFASSYELDQRVAGEECALQLVLQCLPLPKQFPLNSSTICACCYAIKFSISKMEL